MLSNTAPLVANDVWIVNVRRFETFKSKFRRAKNNASIKAAWILVAKGLSQQFNTPVSSDQCRSKVSHCYCELFVGCLLNVLNVYVVFCIDQASEKNLERLQARPSADGQ